jgi:hypothetical protein
MRPQGFRRLVAGRPPFEPALRQPLRGNPKPLFVIREDPDRLAAAAAEDEQAARKRIGIELLAAELRQRINPLASVDGFNRNQDAQLRRDLDQDAASNKARLSAAKSETEAPFNWIRSLPWRPSTSRVHSGTDCVCGATSSTNAGEAGCRRTSPRVATRRFRSSHATCNSRAVRLIPSFRATSTAADQSSVGIRAFPLRVLLHSSKRPLASSRVIIAVSLRPIGCPSRQISGGKNDLNSCRRNYSCKLAANSHGLLAFRLRRSRVLLKPFA